MHDPEKKYYATISIFLFNNNAKFLNKLLIYMLWVSFRLVWKWWRTVISRSISLVVRLKLGTTSDLQLSVCSDVLIGFNLRMFYEFCVKIVQYCSRSKGPFTVLPNHIFPIAAVKNVTHVLQWRMLLFSEWSTIFQQYVIGKKRE